MLWPKLCFVERDTSLNMRAWIRFTQHNQSAGGMCVESRSGARGCRIGRGSTSLVILGRDAQMITREKLRIYEKFGGDIDGWARASKLSEQSITDQDWRLIDEVLQSLVIVQSGLASPDFEAQARARTADIAQDEDVRGRLFQLAKSKK